MDRNKENPFVSPIWKAARIGERLSPYVAVACVVMAVSEKITSIYASVRGGVMGKCGTVNEGGAYISVFRHVG
jgi:hypothetical protein